MRFFVFFILINISIDLLAENRNDLNLIDPCSEALGTVSIYSMHTENPAMLPVQDADNRLSISHKNHYLTQELNSWKGSFTSHTQWFTTGISLAGYGYEHYNHLALGGSVGRSLSSSVAIGVGVNLLSLYYTGCEGRKNNLTVRIGTVVAPDAKYLISCWIDNPFQSGFLNEHGEEEKLPTVIYGGFRLSLTENTQWSVEAENGDFSTWRIKSGFEYAIKSFAIRCGAFGKPVIPTVGFGFSFLDFALNISGRYHNLLGISLSCGIQWKFPQSLTD